MKKDRLYTVNKWNKSAVGNVFDEGGLFKPQGYLAPSLGGTQFSSTSNLGINNINLTKPNTVPRVNWSNGVERSKAIGTSAGKLENFRKANGLSSVTSKPNVSGNVRLLPSIGAVGAALGGVAGDAIRGGFDDGGVGSSIQNIGGQIGSLIPGPVGGFISFGSGVVGGLFSRMFGVKENKENTNFIKQNTQNAINSGNTLAASSDNASLVSNAGKMIGSSGFNWEDLYQNGWFTSKGTRLGNNLIAKENTGLNIQSHGLATGAENVDTNMDRNALKNFAAFGGPLGTNMGAVDYGFMSDFLTMKNNQKNTEGLDNPFAGVSPAFFAKGGKIEIKHPGRLTALKKRTGKTEAELWAEGNPSVRKMITFARNARKFKHAYGGYLDAVNNLLAFGGDLETHGGDYPTKLTHIDAGGSHEENPNQGVQIGKDQEGTPNLVEEGEVIYDDYVFSNRISVDDATKERFNLSKKKDLTYADLAKKLEKNIAETPNDPISQATFKAQMQTLQEEQERQKQEMETKRAKEAFESLSPEEQVAVMQQQAAQEQAAQDAVIQEEAMTQQQVQPSPEEIAMAQQQEQMTQPEIVEDQSVMAEGGNLFEEGGSKKNVGTWKNDKENHWDVFTKPGLKRYIENIRQRLDMAPDEESKTAVRKDAMNELNSLQQSYYDHIRNGIGKSNYGYSEDVLNHQKLFDRLFGNTGFYTKDDNGNIKNLIAEAINLPKGAATEDKPDNWFDGYNGPRTSIRNFGSTSYGDDAYYKDLVDDFADLGLTYAPNDNWKDDNGTLYGLSIPEIDAAKEAAEKAPKVWDWNTGSWIDRPAEATSEQKVLTPTTPTPTPQITSEDEDVVPRHRAEWPRYAGLFGPVTGLTMMTAGIGRPDYSGLDSALAMASEASNQSTYIPIGDKLQYSPLDIWYEQNRLDQNSRATDRVLTNSSNPARMAGILTNSYNNQIASAELGRKALEYNDTKKAQVADFNRNTDLQNSHMGLQSSIYNAEMANKARHYRSSLAADIARQKLENEAGWYNSLYSNINNLYKGMSELGRENEDKNWRDILALSGAFGNLNPEIYKQLRIKKKSRK